MHEMALMEGLLDLIRGAAREQGFTHVARVVLEVGRLSGVEAEAMRFAFDVGTAGTVAEGALLEIEETEGAGRCLSCGRESPVQAFYDPCPACGDVPLVVTAGRDMRLRYLDVD